MNQTTLPLLIAFGANLDPLAHLQRGLSLLHAQIGLQAISTIYRTPPLGPPEQPDYLNGAVLSHCTLPITRLKPLLREIEACCGRTRNGHPYGPRTLDLDVAMMGETCSTDPTHPLPDPDILHRPFLLHALAQLAPQLRHPANGQSLAQLAATLPPPSPPLIIDTAATKTLHLLLHPLDDSHLF